jgi:hypothetical protein
MCFAGPGVPFAMAVDPTFEVILSLMTCFAPFRMQVAGRRGGFDPVWQNSLSVGRVNSAVHRFGSRPSGRVQ